MNIKQSNGEKKKKVIVIKNASIEDEQQRKSIICMQCNCQYLSLSAFLIHRREGCHQETTQNIGTKKYPKPLKNRQNLPKASRTYDTQCPGCGEVFMPERYVLRHLLNACQGHKSEGATPADLEKRVIAWQRDLLLTRSQFECKMCGFYADCEETLCRHRAGFEHRQNCLEGGLTLTDQGGEKTVVTSGTICELDRSVDQSQQRSRPSPSRSRNKVSTHSHQEDSSAQETSHLTCHKCNKTLKSAISLKFHMDICLHKHSPKTWVCSQCGKQFVAEMQLTRHTYHVHSGKQFKCLMPDCSRVFRSKNLLRQHTLTHSNQRLFPCPHEDCDYASKTKHTLDAHVTQHGVEKGKYSCDYCDYRSATSSNLRRHLRGHVDAKPFRCPHCQFVTSTHDSLRKHVLESRKHPGLPLYPCPWCSVGVNKAREMRDHIVAQHMEMSTHTLTEMEICRLLGLYMPEEDRRQPIEGESVRQPIVRFPRGVQTRIKRPPDEMDGVMEDFDYTLVFPQPSGDDIQGPGTSQGVANLMEKSDRYEDSIDRYLDVENLVAAMNQSESISKNVVLHQPMVTLSSEGKNENLIDTALCQQSVNYTEIISLTPNVSHSDLDLKLGARELNRRAESLAAFPVDLDSVSIGCDSVTEMVLIGPALWTNQKFGDNSV